MNSDRKHYQTFTQLLQSIVRQICLCWISLYPITHKRANLFTSVVTTSYQECHNFVSLVYIVHVQMEENNVNVTGTKITEFLQDNLCCLTIMQIW